MLYIKSTKRSSLVAQQVKDPVVSLVWLRWLLQHGFNPWTRNFHMLQVHQKKKSKNKNKQTNKKNSTKSSHKWQEGVSTRDHFVEEEGSTSTVFGNIALYQGKMEWDKLQTRWPAWAKARKQRCRAWAPGRARQRSGPTQTGKKKGALRKSQVTKCT